MKIFNKIGKDKLLKYNRIDITGFIYYNIFSLKYISCTKGLIAKKPKHDGEKYLKNTQC